MQNQGKKSFVFYGSWWEAIKNLPRDVQGDVLTAIIEYGLSGETTGQLKPIAKALLALVKPQIDANNQKFENGRKGGRPNLGDSQGKTKPKPNDNQAETYNELCNNENGLCNNENGLCYIALPSNPPSGGGADLEEFARKQKELEAKEAGLCAKEQELLKLEAALKAKKHSELPDTGFVSPEYAETFTAWLEYKRERRESYKSGKSLKAAYSKLLQLSGNDPAKASAIVEQSMANNWAGLFELKIPSYGNSGTRTGVVLADNSTGKYDNDDEKWKR